MHQDWDKTSPLNNTRILTGLSWAWEEEGSYPSFVSSQSENALGLRRESTSKPPWFKQGFSVLEERENLILPLLLRCKKIYKDWDRTSHLNDARIWMELLSARLRESLIHPLLHCQKMQQNWGGTSPLNDTKIYTGLFWAQGIVDFIHYLLFTVKKYNKTEADVILKRQQDWNGIFLGPEVGGPYSSYVTLLVFKCAFSRLGGGRTSLFFRTSLSENIPGLRQDIIPKRHRDQNRDFLGSRVWEDLNSFSVTSLSENAWRLRIDSPLNDTSIQTVLFQTPGKEDLILSWLFHWQKMQQV